MNSILKKGMTKKNIVKNHQTEEEKCGIAQDPEDADGPRKMS